MSLDQEMIYDRLLLSDFQKPDANNINKTMSSALEGIAIDSSDLVGVALDSSSTSKIDI